MSTKKSEPSAKLLSWYEAHRVEYIWDTFTEPYHIWVSEVMLQQTRVDQAQDYFLRFVNRFPDVHTFAQASEEEVLKMWQGLGYYSRARNLLKGARYVVAEHDGKLPRDKNALLQVPGIGPYTAEAISSFAYGKVEPALDGNLHRVLSRIFFRDIDRSSAIQRKQMSQMAMKLISRKQPGQWNRAMMLLGREICKPRNPQCSICPMNSICLAHLKEKPEKFPVKKSKKKKKIRHFHYFWIQDGEAVFFRQRTQSDIWKGLYELPLIENQKSTLTQEEIWGGLRQMPVLLTNDIRQLTHQTIHLHFYAMNADSVLVDNENTYRRVSLDEIPSLPMSQSMSQFVLKMIETGA